MRVAIYKRVSTEAQDTAMQEHAIAEWMRSRPTPTSVVVYEDVGISGKSSKRPGYQAMLAAIAAGEVDAVVVYRLDRLSRDAITALSLLIDWLQRGIEFYAVDQKLLQLGGDNPFRLTMAAILSEIAQVERETIVQRVKDGLRAARSRGVRLGPKPKWTASQHRRAVKLIDAGKTYREIAKELGVSASTVLRNLRRGVANEVSQ